MMRSPQGLYQETELGDFSDRESVFIGVLSNCSIHHAYHNRICWSLTIGD
jgi:hypothetical protein